MTKMARFGPGLVTRGSWYPSLAFFRGGIGRRRTTGVGGIPMHTGFKGLDPLQEAEELLLHTHWSLLPILSRNAQSIRKGARIKLWGAHDAVSSYLVSTLLPHNGCRVSTNLTGERLGRSIVPRDHIRKDIRVSFEESRKGTTKSSIGET
jgi:hypothetical protein